MGAVNVQQLEDWIRAFLPQLDIVAHGLVMLDQVEVVGVTAEQA